MSYDIYFINSDRASSANIDEFLESEVSQKDDHYISKAEKNEIKAELDASGLSFETFEGRHDGYVELNFATYQISMSNSEIAISLPYWDINSSDPIGNEVKQIAKVLIGRGFKGYDPQTGQFCTDSRGFSSEFGRVNQNVNEHFSSEVSSEKKKGDFWRRVKLGLIFVAVFLLVKLLFALVGKLF